MKKIACVLLILCAGVSLYAFDRRVAGSWGLVMGSEVEEFIRFGQNEVMIMDEPYREGDFEEADGTIFIYDFDGDSVIIQYFLLSESKLLLNMINPDNPAESLTLILSRI